MIADRRALVAASHADMEVEDVRRELAELIRKARIAIRNDPADAACCLDSFEHVLLKVGGATVENEAVLSPPGGLAPWQAAAALRYIEKNLTSRLAIADLCQLVRLSENHFARAFKISFGCPPHAYVIQMRVERAKSLMRSGDWPLAQIALECGLADQAHLSRLFKRLVGQSPAAWRRECCRPIDARAVGSEGAIAWPELHRSRSSLPHPVA